jgi:hypothetical protein
MPDDLPYRVSWSRKVMDALKELGSQAQRSSGPKELASMVREIDERLRREPVAFGEVYLSKGAIEAHLAIHKFMAIDFAVDKERKFVLVRRCRLLSGHDL